MTEHTVSSFGGNAIRIGRPDIRAIRIRSGPYEATARPQAGPGAWTTLPWNLSNNGAQARTRVLTNGDTYLYVGLNEGSGPPDSLNVFNVSSPGKLAHKGGVHVWTAANSVSARQIPQFWPDEFPQFMATNSGKSQAPGSTGNGGMQVVDLGPPSAPYDAPLLGDVQSVFYGSFSGGTQTGLTIQWGERAYWGASYGFTNVWNLEAAHLNDLNLTGDTQESTWFGASEALPSGSRRFMSGNGLVHHPLEPYFYDMGNALYTLIWLDYNEFSDWPLLSTQNGPGIGVDGAFGLHDEPTLWAVTPNSISTGIKITYVDVSDPLTPVLDGTWIVTTDGTFMGSDYPYGMAQATYDHDKLLLMTRTGSPGSYVYTLYHLNIVTREILNTWIIENPPIAGPQGSFVTDNGAYYGWWDTNGVYIMDLGFAPERQVSSYLSNAERIRRK